MLPMSSAHALVTQDSGQHFSNAQIKGSIAQVKMSPDNGHPMQHAAAYKPEGAERASAHHKAEDEAVHPKNNLYGSLGKPISS